MYIDLWVKPGSRKGPLVVPGVADGAEEAENHYTVFLTERAIDGRANRALVQVLATYFDLPKSSVRVLRGHTSRRKTVEIDRPSDM